MMDVALARVLPWCATLNGAHMPCNMGSIKRSRAHSASLQASNLTSRQPLKIGQVTCCDLQTHTKCKKHGLQEPGIHGHSIHFKQQRSHDRNG